MGIRGGDSTAGKPRTALLWPKDVEIVENWDVVGLSGTGSHELKVDGVVVPEDWTFIRGGTPTVDEPLYRYPSIAYAAQVLAVVNLGVGRAALDYAIKVGAGRTGITGAPKLADRAYYRIDLAKAEATLRSARAFFYEVTDEAYATVVAGDPVPEKLAALLRLSSTHVAKAGASAVHTAFQLSGTGASTTQRHAAVHARGPGPAAARLPRRRHLRQRRCGAHGYPAVPRLHLSIVRTPTTDPSGVQP